MKREVSARLLEAGGSRHSGQAKHDPESRYIKEFWIPAFAGMTEYGLSCKSLKKKLFGAEGAEIAEKNKVYIKENPKTGSFLSLIFCFSLCGLCALCGEAL
jgi:hypothetical protein